MNFGYGQKPFIYPNFKLKKGLCGVWNGRKPNHNKNKCKYYLKTIK